MTAALAVSARRRRPRARPRKPIEFSRMVHRIADQHGIQAAQAWSEAVLRHQKNIDMAALRSAIASKNIRSIEAVVGAQKLQQTAARGLRQPFTAAAQAAGSQSAAVLKGHGLAASFNAVHPNVVNYARTQAAQLVVAVPAETKQVIAEVIAMAAEFGLTAADQAKAIREVVGLPPNWAVAPGNLGREIRQGHVGAATSRRLSASAKQQIRSRIAAGTVDDAFVDKMMTEYSESLVNRRALNIARTETLRASHHGLGESWKQAQEQGVLPETAKRFWILTPDDRLCPICLQIPQMNPNGVGLDEPFETPEGPVDNPPAVHPNCRCSVGLLPNVPDDFDVTQPDEDPDALRGIVAGPDGDVVPTDVMPSDQIIPPPRVLAGATPPSPEVHAQVVSTLREMHVDPSVVTYKRLQKFSLESGGPAFETAGEYSRGRVYLDPRHVRLGNVKDLVTHEAQHLKFDVAVKTDARVKKFVERNYAKLRTEDGVTAYSRQHWEAYEKRQSAFPTLDSSVRMEQIPVNETLSEIAASRATSAGEAFYGSETYRTLGQMIDDAYQRAVHTGRARVTSRSGIKLRAPADAPKPPLRDLAAKEVPQGQYREGLTNHLDTVFEDNFRAAGEELVATEHYMSYHYGSINNALRSGNVEGYLQKAYGTTSYRNVDEAAELIAERVNDIKGLDKLLARMPELGDNATVWRAVDNVTWLSPKGTNTFVALENAQTLVGTEFIDAGYVSTTTLRNAATGWTKLKSGGGTLIEIRLPPNTKGAWMKKVAREQQENAVVKREYLLPRGARFKVVSARVEGGIDAKSILHLVVEYIP